MRHWSSQFVGLSADDVTFAGAPSPCWEICRQPFYQERGELLSPLSAGNGWRAVDPEEARDFDLVLFRQGGLDAHVGLIAGGPWRMLHLPDGGQSIVERFDNGSFLPRLKGVYRREETAWSVIRPARAFEALGVALRGADAVTLIAAPFVNPDEDCTFLTLDPGQTLGELVGMLYPLASDEQRKRIVVRVGRPGMALDLWQTFPAGQWHARPRPDMIVLVEPLPGAISFRKIVGLLAIAAAMAAGQFYLGPALGGALFGAGTAGAKLFTGFLTAGLTAGVSFALRGFLAGGRDDDKPIYAATGWENQAKPYEPVPIPAGKTRDAPPYAAFPYISLESRSGPDGFDPNSGDLVVLHGLFIEGVGKMEITKRKFGDTPIEKFNEPDETDGEPTPLTVQTAYIVPGDPWPFIAYDHQVIPTDPSTMGATFENGSDGGEEDDWVERYPATDASELEIILAFPSGLYNSDDEGSPESASVFFEVEYAEVDTEVWVAVPWTEVRAKKRTTFYRGFKWEVDPAKDYKVRMRKNGKDGDFDADSSQDGFVWFALQAHRPFTPFKVRVPVTATAFRVISTDQLQGTLKAYNRIASRVCLDWDSGTQTWIERETTNPFSYARFRLQSPVLAKPYADADIDLAQFAAAHEYAASKGMHYNTPGLTDRPLLDEVNEACGAGLARARRYNGPWGLIVDRPRTTVIGHITPANGWDISVSTRRLPDADGFRVTFSCETRDYATKTRTVPFPGVTEVTKPLDLSLPGKTHPDEVFKEAMRAYFRDFVYRLPSWSASAGWEHLTFDPAEGMLLLDDGLTRSRLSTLVVDVSGNVVTIADKYLMEAGKSYRMRFRHLPPPESEGPNPPPAIWVIRDLTTVAGLSNALFVSGSGTLPSEDALVTIYESTDALQEGIVERIEAGDETTGRLILRPHAPEIEEEIDALVIPPFTGIVGDPVMTTPVAPSVPLITEIRSSTQVTGGGVIVFVRRGPGGGTVTSIDVEHRIDGAGAFTVIPVPGDSGRAEFSGYTLGQVIDIRAIAHGPGGDSAYTAIIEHTYGESDLIPPDNIEAEYVFDIIAGSLASKIHVSWDAVVAGDSYRLQFGLQGGGAPSAIETEADATEVTTIFVSDAESYRVRLKTIRGASESTFSAWVNVPDTRLITISPTTFLAANSNTLLRAG